jgi:HPt (histidine-containing phosphotransfer) domain-containing protein
MSDLTSGALDPEQIELLLSLDDGEGAVLSEIAGEFLVMSDSAASQLHDALRSGDLPLVQRAAHSLKGAGANVGAVAVADLCADIETQAREGQRVGTTALIESLDTEIVRVRQALDAVTNGT